MNASLIWFDRKTGSHMLSLNNSAEAERRMSRLRREARLINSSGNIFGEVTKRGYYWRWWFDPEVFGESKEKEHE